MWSGLPRPSLFSRDLPTSTLADFLINWRVRLWPVLSGGGLFTGASDGRVPAQGRAGTQRDPIPEKKILQIGFCDREVCGLSGRKADHAQKEQKGPAANLTPHAKRQWVRSYEHDRDRMVH